MLVTCQKGMWMQKQVIFWSLTTHIFPWIPEWLRSSQKSINPTITYAAPFSEDDVPIPQILSSCERLEL